MTIEEYLLKMKSLAHSLMAVGHAITDEELVLYILGGLGPEHESVVVPLTSKDFVTILEFQYVLQTHKMRLENSNTSAMAEVSNSTVHLSLEQNTLDLLLLRYFNLPLVLRLHPLVVDMCEVVLVLEKVDKVSLGCHARSVASHATRH